MSRHGDIATGPGWELRLGDYREVLADVTCDAVITDPPYSERTHSGQRHGRRGNGYAQCDGLVSADGLVYAHWSPDDMVACAEWAHARASGWCCAFSSHDGAPVYAESWEALGRYVFAPLACVTPGMNVRLAGDGPSNWTCWLTVARHRSKKASEWGTLPGAYIATHHKYDGDLGVAGAKSVGLMRAIVRDYSRPGDTVVDPCAGGGTTLLAAVIEGRRAIGAELDPETFDKAVARLRRGYTPIMDFGEAI